MLPEMFQRMLLTYHSELIACLKNVGPIIHVAVMAQYTPDERVLQKSVKIVVSQVFKVNV
jgi:hypothetical protein